MPDSSGMNLIPAVDQSVEADEPVVATLFEEGAPDFANLAVHLHPETMSSERLAEVQAAAAQKIMETMLAGHFKDLRGAKELLGKLGLSDLTLTEEVATELNSLLPRLNTAVLRSLGLCVSVTGERDWNQIDRILRGVGFQDSELTEENMARIMAYRHILLALKERSVDRVGKVLDLLQLEAGEE